MADRPLSMTHMTNPQDDPTVQYRALSGLAVGGLLLGLLSPLALLSAGWWLIPLAGVVLSLWALARINAEPSAFIGRKAALVGLAISLLMLVAAPADRLTHRWLLQREARQFAEIWFGLLRDNQPHKAHQLATAPVNRLPLDSNLWESYSEGSELRQELEAFVQQSDAHSLLALGPKAQVRLYQTGSVTRRSGTEDVELFYAVTYTDGGGKKSYFIRLVLERVPLSKPNRADWYVANSEAGVRPPGRAPSTPTT